jgi:hypothetical protein
VTAPEIGASSRAVAEEVRKRHLAPDDVERLRRALFVEGGSTAEQRRSPIRADDEVAVHLTLAVPSAHPNAGHAPVFPNEIARRRPALETEGREARRLCHQQLEHRRL